MIYIMDGLEWNDKTVRVDVKKTPKTITITPVDKKPSFFMYACIEQLWDKGKITISDPKGHKLCRHRLMDWGDGTYTLYPDRAGLPYYMEPEGKK